ncbi:endonuclease/exonuclease/phosphatase family protein [Clostridium butyricum]|uniref:Endonuclease/exonuclease/phosphatase family protein n=1 Tax=Clostridium butyricum TaxID=1492 RepID=A0AAP9UDG1_CLOBU|nr:endonuclease/exonuclease/phosphatase family protein [Clostridium butyricum]MBZ5746261.1 endonuclease/exonuclease/phosphatase family protein [Clostridium butyricum]MDI9210073.1 endonuclease/exonuclease/phosphatase family protein [Clostridium butyricum]QMW90148.1 endonuclease/exonuclease/phosphatase family protein [Clostridium butyricum]BBK77769.1 endonuclease/exonuclease/phosphatase family protein [Clostridium butyricum]GEQ24741.1 endonuclease/exonuclease/phosphatase family protein [Clostrid
MRIVTWNCNGGFRNKFEYIKKYNADIYVIQECENPLTSDDNSYKEFAQNYMWVGYKNKGLGIFGNQNIKLTNNNWDTYGLEWFISCTVNDNFTLLGLWGSGNYIEDIYVYLKIHQRQLEGLEKVVVCGDFNSNSIWDKKHKRRTHSAVVEDLEKLNLYSCYHLKNDEVQGSETKPTFYLYRKSNKGYHIDYCFCSKEHLKDLQIGEFSKWIKLSDHMPLVVDVDI